jgi:hypothetical protein
MTSQVITSTQFTIPANTSFYGNFPLNGGNLLSVGIQNFGFVTKTYPTQLMITNNTNVFFQIDNQNSFDVNAVIWGVADSAGANFGAIYATGSAQL